MLLNGFCLFVLFCLFSCLELNIERLQQTTCCCFCNLEKGLAILFGLHIFFGVLGIVFGILAFGSSSGAVIVGGVFSLISGMVSFGTGWFGIHGEKEKNPPKIKNAFYLFLIGAFIAVIGYILTANWGGVAFTVIIDGYFAYVIHQYWQILDWAKNPNTQQQ